MTFVGPWSDICRAGFKADLRAVDTDTFARFRRLKRICQQPRYLVAPPRFQCDVGMTGPHDGILGRRIDRVMETLLTANPTQFEVSTGDNRINGTIVDIDPATGLATNIERLCVRDIPNQDGSAI